MNKINGKLYFGITDGSFIIRKNRHKNDSNRGTQFTFHKALRKYGFNNFEWNYRDYSNQVNNYNELKLLNIFETIADASRITDIDGGSISKCCSNILYSAGGYIWKDKELVKDIV